MSCAVDLARAVLAGPPVVRAMYADKARAALVELGQPLGVVLPPAGTDEVVLEQVLMVVETATGIGRGEILGERRTVKRATARKVCYWLLRNRCGRWGWWRIAFAVGKKSHQTIIHGARWVDSGLRRDPRLHAVVSDCCDMLGDTLPPGLTVGRKLG